MIFIKVQHFDMKLLIPGHFGGVLWHILPPNDVTYFLTPKAHPYVEKRCTNHEA